MKKIILLLLTFVTATTGLAQYIDTVVHYYDFYWNIVDPAKEEYYYFGVAKKTADSQWHKRDYYADTKSLQMEGMYLDDSMTIHDGKFYYYHRNGQLETECTYNRGKLVGLNRSYNESGRLIDSGRFKSTGIPFDKSYRWDDSGKLIFFGDYDMKGTGEGHETEYYETGKISGFGKTTKGYLQDSIWTYYDDEGHLTASEEYDSGKLLRHTCYYPNGAEQKKDCDTGYVYPLFDFEAKLELYYIKKIKTKSDFLYYENIIKYIQNHVYISTEVDRKGLTTIKIINNCPSDVRAFLEDFFALIKYTQPARHKNRPVHYFESGPTY